MKLSKIVFLAWMVGRSLFAADTHVASYKGFECLAREGWHEGDYVTRVRFERVGDSFRLSYVPRHLVPTDQPDTFEPQVLGRNFDIAYLPVEDMRILRSDEPHLPGRTTRVLQTRLVRIAEPGCCGHYLSTNEELEVSIQSLFVDENGVSHLVPEQKIEEKFHPSYCKVIE